MKLIAAVFLVSSIIKSESYLINPLSPLVHKLENNQIFNITNIVMNIVKSFTVNKLSEDGKLNFTGIANKYGFNCEEHHVVTEDGYILTNFRIPGDVNKVVLLAHGGTPTSDCWIIRAKQSLAIKLAQQNYDVWAMNFRGTRYSRRHISLDPDKDMNRFFNFTLLEHGTYDLPATIDHILEVTGHQTQITAISHSLGTTSLFILGAARPIYNKMIKLHVPLAAMTYVKDLRGIPLVAKNVLTTLGVTGIFPIYKDGGDIEIFGHITKQIVQALCINTIFSDICLFILSLFVGFDKQGLDTDFFSTLFGHLPGGTSTKVYKLLTQNTISEQFAEFDYGEKRNLEVYRSVKPRVLDLNKVTMKTAFLVGKEDLIATIQDTKRISAALPNVVRYQILPYPKFSHLDFVYGRQMETYLYPYLFDILEKYAQRI